MRLPIHILVAALAAFCASAANDVPVPTSCTPDVNGRMAQLLAANTRNPTDNVMVCGTTSSSSHTQKGGPHGDHQIIPLLVQLPNGSSRPVEVVTNDALDGKVTASAHVVVFAYGQAFFDAPRFAAGVHDVHCSTHAGADNGWVVVNGVKHPTSCGMVH
jgi:hypothetical protein